MAGGGAMMEIVMKSTKPGQGRLSRAFQRFGGHWVYQPLFQSRSQAVAECANVTFLRNGSVVIGNTAFTRYDNIGLHCFESGKAMREKGSRWLAIETYNPHYQAFLFEYRPSLFGGQWYRLAARKRT